MLLNCEFINFNSIYTHFHFIRSMGKVLINITHNYQFLSFYQSTNLNLRIYFHNLCAQCTSVHFESEGVKIISKSVWSYFIGCSPLEKVGESLGTTRIITWHVYDQILESSRVSEIHLKSVSLLIKSTYP